MSTERNILFAKTLREYADIIESEEKTVGYIVSVVTDGEKICTSASGGDVDLVKTAFILSGNSVYGAYKLNFNNSQEGEV